MQVKSKTISQTVSLGKKLASHLSGGEIILLSGPLGAGKTVFTKGIAIGLGIKKDDIISPTFVLLRMHQGRLLLQHFDFYRIKGPGDILSLGYEEYLYAQAADKGNRITVIEWPEKLEFLLPKEFLKVKFVFSGKGQRLLKLTAKGRAYRKILDKFDEDSGN